MFSMIKETAADNEPQGRALAVSLGCIEALEQGNECLKSLSDDQYNWAAAPHITSTIGEHFRHLLDLFHAINLANGKVIDYNFRRRGHAVEKSRVTAIKEIDHLIHWLESMSHAELAAPVTILTEVSMTETQAHSMTSTLERELTFVALHANHHFAMAKVTISLLNLNISDTFGLAPNTLSYLRGQ
ncbi:DinB family protein [Marinomonas ushuaiensis]|nr:DinB family protein [Marinomonas ushuaiensis]